MKNNIFLICAFLSMFCSCSEESVLNSEDNSTTNKVLMLKVDYLTNTFEGGKETEFAENSSEFTITSQYIPASDFGNIKLKYDEVNEVIFDGDIIWMGLGQINYPQNLLLANQFETVATADVVFPSAGFQHILPEPNQVYDYNEVWLAVQNLVKVRQYLISNPNGKVKLYFYTPSVGVGDPADWKWIVLMKN